MRAARRSPCDPPRRPSRARSSLIAFDPGDRRAASAELSERLARSDAALCFPPLEFLRALRNHDLEGVRAALPAGFVFHDHRRAGAGRLSAAEYVGFVGALFQQSPDAIIEPLYFLAMERHGFLAIAHDFGTLADGGAFESVFVQTGGDSGVELFDLDDLDAARARFEALRPDPLRIPPNAATRMRVRTHEAFLARDWTALRSLVSDDFVWEDRGKRALLVGDVELWIASMQQSASPGVRREAEIVASRGDRIALERVLYVGAPGGIHYEMETLRLTELGAAGRLAASITFDPDDRPAAFAEATLRFAADEAAGAALMTVAAVAGWGRTFAESDWDVVRSHWSGDAVISDHRALRFGAALGDLGRDAYLDSLRALAELAPDARTEAPRYLAWNQWGVVRVVRLFGTQRDGGEFENVFLGVLMTDGDRIERYELFDIDDVDAALARFEELCAERA
jgi:ketosteroid isomerase-like protein